MTAVLQAQSNDYWDAVGQWLAADPFLGRATLGGLNGQEIDPFSDVRERPWFRAAQARTEYVARWSWTVSAPWTVNFVAKYCGPKVLDPLAGTGWWAHLLEQRGVDVAASDQHPADGTDVNQWHQEATTHFPVQASDAVDSVREHGDARTLLLSWPPYGDPIGANVLKAYRGDLVVYMGEWGDACGDEEMVEILDTEWEEVAWHQPVVWMGLHDVVAVRRRRS